MEIGVDLASGESKTVWTLLARDVSHPDAFRILGSADDEDSLALLLPDENSQQSGNQRRDRTAD
jgi:hypothetical protein